MCLFAEGSSTYLTMQKPVFIAFFICFDLTDISHNFFYFSVKKMKALHRQEDKQEQAKGLPLHLVPKIIDQTRLPRKQKARNQSVD